MTVSIKQNSQSHFILKLPLVQGQLLGIQRILTVFLKKTFSVFSEMLQKICSEKYPLKIIPIIHGT